MATHYLVDTNVWSETTTKLPNPEVVAWLRKNEQQLFISALSIGEIKSGIDQLPESGMRRPRYQSWLTDLIDRMEGRVLSFNTSVAVVWGQLIASSLAQGVKLPTTDSMIAATAKRHSLVIATRNEADFARTGVKVVNPFSSVS